MKRAKGIMNGKSTLGRFWTLALVTSVFLFSSTGAVQGGGGGREEAVFVGEVFGDITGGPQARAQTIRDNTTQIVISKPSMRLDLTYFQGVTFKVADDGLDCFSDGLYGGPGEGGSMHIIQERDGSGSATAWIHGATANDGVTDVKYRLDVVGVFDDETNWPPALATFNTLRITGWEMSSEGKGKLKNVSCTGAGVFPNPTSIRVERTD